MSLPPFWYSYLTEDEKFDNEFIELVRERYDKLKTLPNYASLNTNDYRRYYDDVGVFTEALRFIRAMHEHKLQTAPNRQLLEKMTDDLDRPEIETLPQNIDNIDSLQVQYPSSRPIISRPISNISRQMYADDDLHEAIEEKFGRNARARLYKTTNKRARRAKKSKKAKKSRKSRRARKSKL